MVRENFKVDLESLRDNDDTGIEPPGAPEAAEIGGCCGGEDEGSMDLELS
jgi:hypothetical protein